MDKLPTICGFCSCGCAFYVEQRNGRVEGLCPSTNHPVSRGRLCIKGWNATPEMAGSDRLRTPLIRRGERLEPASWQEAISFASSALSKILSDSGPQSIGITGSAKTTNEECYSLVKFARSVIGTPNIDGACRFYDASIIRALLDTTGVAASQLDLESLTRASSMLIVGANVTDQLPHVGSRVLDAAENGCRIVVVDSRLSRLAARAHLFVQPRPGTDLIWLRELIAAIMDREMYVHGALEIPGFEELRLSVCDSVKEGLKELCGVETSEITQMAEMLTGGMCPVVMFGLGVLQQADSTEIVKALADVAILLGGSVMPLRGQNNAQGSCDLGLAPDFLPGYEPLSDHNARQKWESVWGCKLPAKPGMSSVDMIRESGGGKIRALMVFGENIALSVPNTKESLKALSNLDFLAVSDLYLTETAQLADVVFPACSFLEKDGTFTNIERRVQRVRKVLEPVGESKPDLEIIADLALALGRRMPSQPVEVMAEIGQNVPQYADVSYAALDESWGDQWRLKTAAEKLASLTARETPDDSEYPFRLIASRLNYHQQTGAMSSRCPILAREYVEGVAELNEDDAHKLGLRPGRPVRISSKTDTLTRIMLLSESVPPGCVHVPHFFGGDSPNRLCSYDCDPTSGVPAYKSCAVKVETAE